MPDLFYPQEHAAGGETSLLMAIRPDLVDLGKALETDGLLRPWYAGQPEHQQRRRTTENKYIGVLTSAESWIERPGTVSQCRARPAAVGCHLAAHRGTPVPCWQKPAAGRNEGNYPKQLPRFVLLGLVLVVLGWRLVPTTSLVSIAGVCFILITYGLAGLGFPACAPKTCTWQASSGCWPAPFSQPKSYSVCFAPQDNSGWGLIEYALVFAVIFGAGVVQAYRSRRIRSGILASVVSSMLASVIWLIFVLLTFYIFRGSARQALVFTAEGNYADFASSGMQDFNAFIMEDFFGGGFFHLVLVPILAILLGTAGGLVGKGLAHRK